MKKLSVYSFAVAAVLLLSACGQNKKTVIPATLDEVKAEMDAIVNAFNEQVDAIQTDVNLSDEDKGNKIETLYEDVIKNYIATGRKHLEAAPDSETAAYVIGELNNVAEDAEMEELLGLLGDKAKAMEPVASILKVREVRKTTAEGQKFMDFEIVQDPENPETSTVKFSDYIGKGKYILVDFWASWCGPCKREIPNIKAVWEKYHGEDFDVLSVAVWDKVEDTKAAALEHGISWLQIINAQKIPTDAYGIEGIPQIILFGPDGTILKRDLRGEAIEAEVAKYVKAK